MDYEEILNKLKRKRDYFQSIDFPIIASDYDLAVKTIEELLEKEKKDGGD